MSRAGPMVWLAGGSLVVLAAALVLLVQGPRPGAPNTADRPLKVYCAAALKRAMQAVAEGFGAETGLPVEFEFGDSGAMLAQISVRPDGDLFLPADDSFVRRAREKGLVADAVPLCRMRAVVLYRPGNPHHLKSFGDLLGPGLTVGLANPDSAAIGSVVRAHLRRLGKWDALAATLTAQFTTVTDAANAVQLGGVDAAIVWDSVAFNYPELPAVRLPELDGAVGRVELAVLASAPDPTGARVLARYAAASDRGLVQFHRFGFTDVEPGSAWTGGDR